MALSTLFLGRQLIELASVLSTNNYALDLCRKGKVAEGTVVIAQNQSGGRGQRGRTWESEAGKNLLFSLILKPHSMDIKRQFCLNKAVALAIRNAIRELFPSLYTEIKWPNDIMIGNRKLAGILMENIISGRQIVTSVAGIGLNVNQILFPEDSGKSVSLKILLEKDAELQDILDSILNHLEPLYLQIKAGSIKSIEDRFNEALWKKGEIISYEYQDKLFSGIISAVDESGKILVEDADGIKSFGNGEIKIII